jgi:hypothetical protein
MARGQCGSQAKDLQVCFVNSQPGEAGTKLFFQPQMNTDKTQIFLTAEDADFRRFIFAQFHLRPSASSAVSSSVFICGFLNFRLHRRARRVL